MQERTRTDIVIPVFYDIDPSHVRKQLQCYAAAFAKHEEQNKQGKILEGCFDRSSQYIWLGFLEV